MNDITIKLVLSAQEQKCPLQTNKNLLIANLFDRERQNRKVDPFNMPKGKGTYGTKKGRPTKKGK